MKNKNINWYFTKPAIFYAFIIFFMLVGLLVIDSKSTFLISGTEESKNADWRGVLTELHGLWFDAIILGFFLAIYEHFRNRIVENQKMISELKIEINHLRGLQTVETSFKIAGLIRMLNDLKVTNIDLTNCYLVEANLSNLNLENATLNCTNMRGANLDYTNLSNTLIAFCELNEATFVSTIFDNTTFFETNLSGSKIYGSNLKNVKFKRNVNIDKIRIDEIVLSQIYVGVKGEDSEKKYFHFIDKNNSIQDYIIYDKNGNSTFIAETWELQKNNPNEVVNEDYKSIIPES